MLRKFWKFIWKDDSLASWIVSLILAFLLVKFIVYPGLGLLFGTTHPVVAVISVSMEHNKGFDEWWEENKGWYLDNSINKEDFNNYIFKDGFNKGDIIVLFGTKAKDIKRGDVIVFDSESDNTKHPIIHRVVMRWSEDSVYTFKTKGDNNEDVLTVLGEDKITVDRVIGKAKFRIPWLGWIKIKFSEIFGIG
jgi:signal peptidase I